MADANLDELIAAYESRGCLRNALRDPEYRPYCLRCNDLVRMEKREPLLWQCVRCLAVHDLRIDGDVLTALRRCRDAEGERDAATHASIHLDDFRVIVGHIRNALEKPGNQAAVSLGRAALRTLEFHDPRFIESEQARLMAEARGGE